MHEFSKNLSRSSESQKEILTIRGNGIEESRYIEINKTPKIKMLSIIRFWVKLAK